MIVRSNIFSNKDIEDTQDLRYEFVMDSIEIVDVYQGKEKVAQVFSSKGISNETLRKLIDHDKYYGETEKIDVKSETITIDKLFVKESYRGKGVGAKVLGHIENVLKNKGYKRIIFSVCPIVESSVSTEELKRLQSSLYYYYKRLGYEAIIDMHSSNNCCRFILMSKDLV